ncbi:MAG: EamA family transporter, partial [Chloroflexi bacterium]|nr:EamA family transporter [Chloroflexota bacterium]
FLAFAQTQNSFEPLARAPAAWIPVLGLALGPTIGALILFNWGLKIVPASNASVVATIEPVMAALLAFLFLGEHLEIWQMIGGGLVIAGAVIQSAGN